MGKKSLKITVNNLNDEDYTEVAYQVVKSVKRIAPNSNISILGASPEVFEGSSNKQIKGE